MKIKDTELDLELYVNDSFDSENELHIEINNGINEVSGWFNKSLVTKLRDHLNKVLGENDDVNENKYLINYIELHECSTTIGRFTKFINGLMKEKDIVQIEKDLKEETGCKKALVTGFYLLDKGD